MVAHGHPSDFLIFVSVNGSFTLCETPIVSGCSFTLCETPIVSGCSFTFACLYNYTNASSLFLLFSCQEAFFIFEVTIFYSELVFLNPRLVSPLTFSIFSSAKMSDHPDASRRSLNLLEIMLSMKPRQSYSPQSRIFKKRLLTIERIRGGTSRGHERKQIKN